MMEQRQQYVTIKGTKDGLTLHLDDTCSFQILVDEIEERLSTHLFESNDRPLLAVRLKIGNRFLSPEQDEIIRSIVRKKNNLVVETIESNVISKQEAIEWMKREEIVPICRMVRSGQILQVKGDLLLIGDVNPGGTVIAGGNIFIMGALRGTAHAGFNGNKEAVIAASIMRPMQLRICSIMNRAPDHYGDEGNEMECAYINEESQIIVDRIQFLTHLRPSLTRLERGMM
ncbi:septum site-determining protein MinC [Bacillus sp. AFS001701]|uniref:septum site-determining protein MinC n=1 Tax=Bacillaceae TaxID=186817 RepID=UPI000BF5744B|nr:septum site-determining protein MinC [Bacillus sp. AFS001701]PET65991.1 septum site-determining protein MinC [Bacillus sp. AFS001701]